MMFIIHAAFALTGLTLTAGAALYIWSLNSVNKQGTLLARVIGFVVMFVAALSLMGTFYLGIKVWREIYLLHLVEMHHLEENSNTDVVSTSVTLPEHHKK